MIKGTTVVFSLKNKKHRYGIVCFVIEIFEELLHGKGWIYFVLLWQIFW